MDMVEQVAKAIYDCHKLIQPSSFTWEETIEPRHREAWLKYARAAIAAMREPTPAMLKACDSIMGGGFQNSHSDLETWQEMIDAALKE